MAMRRFFKTVMAVINCIEKRPWIPMAIYLGVFALFVLMSGLLLANMVDSRWRPFSALTKSEKAGICHVGDYIGWAAVYAAGFSVVVVPVVMLCARRFRAALNVLVMGIAGLGASVLFMLVTGPLWFVIGLEDAQATDAFGDKGAIVEEFKDYSDVGSFDELHNILPFGAKDITVLRKLYFQGHAIHFKCRLSVDDFKVFAAKRAYEFKKYDMAEDLGRPWCFSWHKEGDPLFSQFPELCDGEVVDHHSDGYLSCVAETTDSSEGGDPFGRDLIYVYDSRCSILWAQCWK
ncbi:MAG: hypothetical protein IJG84_00825 [Kiritimatiellae bacterium]|nr:hypothetical protein [Kiritimatiellia bacterium]